MIVNTFEDIWDKEDIEDCILNSFYALSAESFVPDPVVSYRVRA